MEIRTLKYFLAVAREENITKAAETLFLSQPALSRQLMQLEEEVGKKLFVRGKHSITLTKDGMLLKRRAQEILELADKTILDLKENDNALSGIICIGSGELASFGFLADRMNEFKTIYPNVKFEIYSNNTDHIKESINKGLSDIGILLEPTDLSKFEYLRLPITERWGVLIPTENPLSHREYIKANDLKNESIFGAKREAVQGALGAWLGESYDTLNVCATYNLIYNTAYLVEKGMGIAFALEGATLLYGNPKMVFRPLYPEVTLTSVIAWKKSQPQSQAVAKFIQYLRNAI